MAGDWIKMRADLFTHPKVFQIAEALGKDELYAVGALFCFWAWADKHSVDGRVDGATSQLVDRATRVKGFAAALVMAGWLTVDDAGITIPRFKEHNGDSAKERSLKNQRQARWRDGKVDADVDGQASTKASTPPSTGASTREEKRREEKNKEEKSPEASASGKPTQSQNPSPTASRIAAPKNGAAVPKLEKPPAKGWATGIAYASAYSERYGAAPVSNAKTNALLCQVVDRLGVDEAPLVAAFYVGHNAQWYVKNGHALDHLVRDAEKLRTEWATGSSMTDTRARQTDRTQTNADVWGKLIREEEAKERIVREQ